MWALIITNKVDSGTYSVQNWSTDKLFDCILKFNLLRLGMRSRISVPPLLLINYHYQHYQFY